MNASQRNHRGFTLFEALLIVAILAIGFALLLPQLARTRPDPSHHQRINCVNNLKYVGMAFRQWALDNDDKYPMQVSDTNGGAMEWAEAGNVFPIFMVMSNELVTPKLLSCAADNRTQATTFDPAVPPGLGQIGFTNDAYVSYFVGLDAEETQPNMLLTGDSNLELYGAAIPHGIVNLWTNAPVAWSARRHKHHGNVGLADGSVLSLSDSRFRETMFYTGHATNRLVFPPPK